MRSACVLCLLLAALLAAIACGVRTPGPPQNAAAGLGGTSWQLVRFQGSDDKLLTPDEPAKYTIAFATDGSVSARIDCNRGRGTWKSAGPNQLQFGPLALTRAMCPPGSLHDRMVKDWEFVRSYVLKDGHLFLALMADGGIYEFEPIGGSKAAAPNSRVASTGPVEYECTRAGAGNDTIIATSYKTTRHPSAADRGGGRPSPLVFLRGKGDCRAVAPQGDYRVCRAGAARLKEHGKSLDLEELVVVAWTYDSAPSHRSYELLARTFALAEAEAQSTQSLFAYSDARVLRV